MSPRMQVRRTETRHREIPRLIVGVILALVAAVLPSLGVSAPARAELTAGGYAPPALLNPRVVAQAYPAQRDALRRFQEQAVDLTLAHHGLPAGDRAAVQTWARDETLATLWGLMVQAVMTGPAERTADQQNVRDWLAVLARRQVFANARAIGDWYSRVLGKDRARFAELAVSGSEQQLKDFMGPDVITASVEQVTEWGSESLYLTKYVTGLEQGFASVGAAVETRALHLAATPSGSLPGAAILADGGRAVALDASRTAAEIPGGHLIDHSSQLLALAPWKYEQMSSVTKRISAANAAVVRGLLGDIDATKPMWPNWLGTMVWRARRATPSPEGMMQVPEAQTALFGAFVAATLPRPMNGKECDNSLIPQNIYGAQDLWWLFVDDPRAIPALEAPWLPCLNAPSIPSASASDPLFVVRAQGSDQLVQTPSISLQNLDSGSLFWMPTTSTTRLHGNWFVQHITKAASSADIQTLGLAYLDWDGRRNYVSLVHAAGGSYRFAGVKEVGKTAAPDASTCRTKYLCWSSDSIKYVGPDGRKYEAWVREEVLPVGDPWYSSNPTAGQRVDFEPNGFAPAYSQGAVTYGWSFQKEGCGGPCFTSAGPDYFPPAYTPIAYMRWNTPGTYFVKVTATDSVGQTVSKTLSVKVAAPA